MKLERKGLQSQGDDLRVDFIEAITESNGPKVFKGDMKICFWYQGEEHSVKNLF
jgi:hypothetical protein